MAPKKEKKMQTTAVDPYQMSDEEVLEQLAREKADRERTIREARENLARYGSMIPPPPGTQRAESATPRKKREVSPKWNTVVKTCPHCGKEKPAVEGFGIVVRRGIEQPAGWCRQCRSSTDYRKRPRVYNTASSAAPAPKLKKPPKK